MEARNKKIEDWFSMIKQGQIVLPRFQRHEAWKPSQVVALLENILREPPLPIGALLTLEVGDKELFHSRPIVGAPKPDTKPSMHLLDGQQRLTALWRSLIGNYPNLDIFVSINAGPIEGDEDKERDEDADSPEIEAIKRWDRKGVQQPVWADNLREALERDRIPIVLLCPGIAGEDNYQAWKEEVRKSGSIDDEVIERISALRTRVAKYDIPFLSLDVKTGRDTALDVFIKMNTSGAPLKDFDIVVAQLESATGESLHNMVADLIAEVPAAKEYGKIEDSILSVAALLMERPPIKKTYLDTEFGSEFSAVWDRVKHGFKHGVEFLRSEAILNEKCLPSDVVVHLICALWADVPEHAFDKGGNARTLIRKALWRTCYTARYGKTSATRTFADYKVLKRMISGEGTDTCELFDERFFPLPAIEEMVLAGWPGRKDRLPRAILATGLRRGGFDFADAAPITNGNVGSREYHHLYPVGFLGLDRSDELANRALNCALITWITNRKFKDKPPAEYIDARAKAASLGAGVVKQRLESHLVPYEALVAGDYEDFLMKRAELIHRDMLVLCEGGVPE